MNVDNLYYAFNYLCKTSPKYAEQFEYDHEYAAELKKPGGLVKDEADM